MTRLEQIENSVAELGAEELAIFAAWFEQFQAERWDKDIEADSSAGKLDDLAGEALLEFRDAKTRRL
ncbi:MAG: hypothetical protein V7774_09845 [Pseudorhizobium pelagicum]|uniref:hypothetical protein n=1 Tax=Pseudorhizobium pelagicum TaxID=1509405 RepID=UPI003460F4A8